ncbi:MAG: hypothetical protein FIA97_12195 [Methylococcaceae bacterium]|nr:hypothetical protein [Methylococcaceae bacterium]
MFSKLTPLYLAVVTAYSGAGIAANFDQYAITDLGSIVSDTASANNYSYALDINDRGDIVGLSKGFDGQFHAVIRLRGQSLTDLGVGIAESINNHRHFVGRNEGPNYVMWKLGPLGFTATDFGIPNNGVWLREQAIKLNEMNEVAGVSNQNYFFWKDGFYTDLGYGDGNGCFIEQNNIGLNNRGDVSFSVGFLYESSTLTQTGVPGNPDSSYTYLYSINDAREMVGLSKALPGRGGAYYSPATGYKNPVLGTTGQRALSDINNAGLAVGGGDYGTYSGNEINSGGGSFGNRAYIYSPSDDSYAYLDTLVPAFQNDPGATWNLKIATAINDAGQIVGVGINPQGKIHGFLLTPLTPP